MTRDVNDRRAADQRPTVRIQPLSNQELATEWQRAWKTREELEKVFPRPTQDDLELSQEEDQEHAQTD